MSKKPEINNITLPVYKVLKGEIDKKPTFYEADNIVSMSSDTISKLKPGDVVLKKDATGYHSYIVSYKKDGTGICLTYCDASVVETVSYDYVDGSWVYNSTDVTHLGRVTPQEVIDALVGQNISPANISATEKITGGEIIEIMNGYSFVVPNNLPSEISYNYVSACKNGNKLTLILSGVIQTGESASLGNIYLGKFNIPSSVGVKLYGESITGLTGVLDIKSFHHII